MTHWYSEQSYGGDYHRSVGFRPTITDGVRWLLIANVVCFIVQQLAKILDGVLGRYWFDTLFGLMPRLVLGRGLLWQPVTYMFLHGGIIHILFNLLWLWIFGCDVERRWGTRRFVRFYLLGGLAGAILTLLIALWSVHMAQSLTIGASGAVLAVLAAYAMLFPDNRITLLFMFVLPITMKAKHLAIGCMVITVLGVLSQSSVRQPGGPQVAYLAHLGGLAFGYLYVRYGASIEMALRRRRARRSERRLWARAAQREAHNEFMRKEVDPILEKIAREGLKSLTRRERKILRRAQKAVQRH